MWFIVGITRRCEATMTNIPLKQNTYNIIYFGNIMHLTYTVNDKSTLLNLLDMCIGSQYIEYMGYSM